MKKLLQAAGTVALLSIAACFGSLAWVASKIPGEAQQLREEVASQMDALRAEAATQVEGARADVLAASERQIAALRVEVLARADKVVEVADSRIGDSLGRVDAALARVDGVIAIAGNLEKGLAPVLANTASITAHADGAAAILFRRDALPAQLLGLTGAAKITLGEAATTMRTLDAAMPTITANIKRATDESAHASQAAAGMMINLSRATKPLPAWLRIPLSITGALAPTVAGAVSAAAATGAFK